MKRHLATALALALIFAPFASAADEATEPAANIPELKPLDGYAGTWDITITIKNPDQAEGVERTGKSVGKWLHNGRFLHQSWTINEADDFPGANGSIMRTYDPRGNRYRSWHFDSAGMAEESEGSWDEETRTMTFTARENLAGGTTINKSTFHDDGRETWSILIKDRDGSTLAEVQGESVRRGE